MKELTCIICPNGCNLIVDDNNVVTGNMCKRGAEFGIEELTNPQRTLTTTCKTAFIDTPVVPVKTDRTIKKELLQEAVKEVNKVIIDKPLKMGDIVIKNILGTDANIVMCSNILKEKKQWTNLQEEDHQKHIN